MDANMRKLLEPVLHPLQYLGHFVRFYRPRQRYRTVMVAGVIDRVPIIRPRWYFCWATYSTFIRTPWLCMGWRRDILRALKYHVLAFIETRKKRMA